MYSVFYLENGEIPHMVGKYKTREDADDALETKKQTTGNVNPYWIWVEETK